jgi:hypothetical protein
VLVGTERDVSWEHGDLVFYDLSREGLVIELEYYEHGELVAYPMDEAAPKEGDSTVPFFVLEAPTVEECRAAFLAEGWLEPGRRG